MISIVICLCCKDLRFVDVDGVKVATRQSKTRKNCGALSALLPSKKTRREGTSGTTLARLSTPQSFRVQNVSTERLSLQYRVQKETRVKLR